MHVFEDPFGEIGPLSEDSDEFLRAERQGPFVDLPDKNDLTYTDPQHEKLVDHHDGSFKKDIASLHRWKTLIDDTPYDPSCAYLFKSFVHLFTT